MSLVKYLGMLATLGVLNGLSIKPAPNKTAEMIFGFPANKSGTNEAPMLASCGNLANVDYCTDPPDYPHQRIINALQGKQDVIRLFFQDLSVQPESETQPEHESSPETEERCGKGDGKCVAPFSNQRDGLPYEITDIFAESGDGNGNKNKGNNNGKFSEYSLPPIFSTNSHRKGHRNRQNSGHRNDTIPYDIHTNQVEEEFVRVCRLKTDHISPRAAKNTRGKFVFIVNDDTFIQKVEVGLCENPGSECGDGVFSYKTECRQQFLEHKLVSLGQDGEKVVVDTFKFASSCSCHFKSRLNFVF